MPLYQGELFGDPARASPSLGLEEGRNIGVKLARAAAALHRAGIIHRDIKPDNVILKGNGSLKLIDLGVVSIPGLEEFAPGDIPGTPGYMAPELFGGRERPVELTTLRPDLPAWLQAALGRAIARDSVERFREMIGFAVGMEAGSARAPVAVRHPRTLYECDPIQFWQGVAALLALALLLSLLWH